jgi:uncharacterized protein YrrD
MRKGKDTIGTSVIAFDDGRAIHTVHDVIVDREHHRLLGFVVQEGGWFAKSRLLPLAEVQAIGPDAVIISSARAIEEGDRGALVREFRNREPTLKDTQVSTTDGRLIGAITDVYFDERTGAIDGYEISAGSAREEDRRFLPASMVVRIGDRVAFVPPEAARLLSDEWTGGKSSSASAEPPDLSEDGMKDAIGRRLTRTVTADSRLVVGAAGQIVTEEVLYRARAFGRQRELMEAAGLHRPAPAVDPPQADLPVN